MRARIKKMSQAAPTAVPKPLPKSASPKLAHAAEVPKERDQIVIGPSDPQKYTLDDLVARITPSNRHKEIAFGRARGRELI
jgi:antitoxin MazE